MSEASVPATSGHSLFRGPNGLEFLQYDEAETKFVYKEIFEDRVYLRHGVAVKDGDCVVDIAPNIGLFTLYCQEHFKQVRSFAFEPCPPIFAIMSQNIARYGDRVTAYRCGISDRMRTETFTFYPHYSIMSGFHAHDLNDTRALRAGVRGQWRDGFPDAPELEDRHVDAVVESALGQKQEYSCELRSLADVITEARIERIDLLKVDAEGSELDVLVGVGDANWSRIRKIAMEIHDSNGPSATEVRSLLQTKGFKCVFEKESHLSDSDVVNCFAVRE